METKELWMDEEFCKKVDEASDTEEIIRLGQGGSGRRAGRNGTRRCGRGLRLLPRRRMVRLSRGPLRRR